MRRLGSGFGKPTARSERGFTFVEVMLAVTILGLGMTVLLTAASRCLAVMKIAKNYQTAQWVMDLGRLEHSVPQTNNVWDMEVAPHTYPNGFTFSRTVEEDEDEDGLYVVRARVSWSDKDKESCEEVVRYVLQTEKKK